MNKMRTIIISVICLCLTLAAFAANGPEKPIPDLTKGEELERVNKRWAGPIGIYCGAWRARQRSDEQRYIRQLQVLEIGKGSPADGVLEVGDVILGADGTGAAKVPLFDFGREDGRAWPMIPIAEAITEAEARDPAELKLLIWRKGVTKTIPIQLEYLGRYSETAPYNCPKSKNILRKGIKALYEENKPDKSGFGILCLLAADDPSNRDNDKYQARAKEWVYQLEPGGSPWFSGPKLMALAEYYMKSKDEGIMPKLAAQAQYHAEGVSWFGTAGHRWSEPAPDGSHNGRIAGYGPITASGALGYLGLSLAREAGVKSPAVEASHKAQRAFFGHYAFKSNMGYGEHPYGLGSGGDYNGKQATSGLAIGLDDDGVGKAKYFSRIATLGSIHERQYAHGGSFFGQVFHPLGAVQGGEKSANMQFREIHWHLDLKRRWDHTRIYDSSGNGYSDFNHGATALIFYAAPLKAIYLTGRGQKKSLKFTDAEFQELVEIKNFDASKATTRQLLEALLGYQGMLREPAANELARRVQEKADAAEWPALIDQLLSMATNREINSMARAGACLALVSIKHKSRDPVSSLKSEEIAKTMVDLLKDPEAYMRFAGIRVLQKLNPEAVRPHVNAIMDAVVATDRPTFPLDEEDPLQWAHGEMGELLFKHVLAKSIDGVDRPKLIAAIRSLLKTPNGGARGAVASVMGKLSKEETLQVADLLVDNIRVAPPANAMGGNKVSRESQSVLAKYLFEEALPLAAEYGVGDAIKNKIPEKYGRAAFDITAFDQFIQVLGDQKLTGVIDTAPVAQAILKGEPSGELSKLKRIFGIRAENENLKLPAIETKLGVNAFNYAVRDEAKTRYTWRKVHGPGKVSFSPNGTGQSKLTSVSFTGQKPGKYRFEVTMSDSLGLSELRETVVVNLYDTNGKMPPNRPPVASFASLDAAPGQPVPVTLRGTDPDGDDLGFVITQLPKHGKLADAAGHPIAKLSAVDGPCFYTAYFGRSGMDQLSFSALDGQGEAAAGVVEFNVSDKNVGVVVYEGFDYPEGPVHGLSGSGSFGFVAPWEGKRGEGDPHRVLRTTWGPSDAGDASLRYAGLPVSGGRVSGHRHNSLSRKLDRGVLSANRLLDNGKELWFSVLMTPPNMTTFALQGSDLSLGFKTERRDWKLYAMLNGEKAGTARNPWSRSMGLRFSKDQGNLIVGRCIWGKTDQDPDRLEIHRVYDAPGIGPVLLEEPVCVLEEPIAQATLDTLYLSIDNDVAVDEIRIGPSFSSVMVGTRSL